MAKSLDRQVRDRVLFEIKGGTKYIDATEKPSEDLNAAWRAVEKIGVRWRGFEFMVQWNSYSDMWEAGWYEGSFGEYESRATCESKSVSEALCLAVLKVRDIEDSEQARRAEREK